MYVAWKCMSRDRRALANAKTTNNMASPANNLAVSIRDPQVRPLCMCFGGQINRRGQTRLVGESLANLSLEIAPRVYNSLADKAYRFFSRGEYDSALREDTIESFLERSCTPGPLSQTFHTDLPRTFISEKKAHFRGWPIQKDESMSFERLYPGASGIISFSHVGFDSTLDEAIVSTGFVCGGLCGTGYRYVLRKKSGRWKVVEWLMVWVS
jgi:hypothetical protein